MADASPSAAAAAGADGGGGATPACSASPGYSHVLQAQQALQRGLEALAALGEGASDSDAAAALLDAALHIRTVAEQQAAEEASAAGEAPFAFRAPDPMPLQLWVPTPARTSTVLRLFDRLETDEHELQSFRAQARAPTQIMRSFVWFLSVHALTRAHPAGLGVGC